MQCNADCRTYDRTRTHLYHRCGTSHRHDNGRIILSHISDSNTDHTFLHVRRFQYELSLAALLSGNADFLFHHLYGNDLFAGHFCFHFPAAGILHFDSNLPSSGNGYFCL